ncbi:MAG: 2-methylcitrate dehydratase [Rhodospirillaceae bacterium]|nr:2-methylcitrate dehydratase [Rhodospirillaceae bacterium]
MSTVTQKIARFVTNAQHVDLPEWSIHEAKRTLLNMLAISLSASEAKGAKILIDWAINEKANEQASIIGTNLKTSASNAALVNGFLCHLQDYDDTHFPTILHPTAPIWPAVLATAENNGSNGHDTLAAFVVGAEIACRIAMSVHPWHYDQGWHITGTAGVFGAAAGAGKLIGLTEQQLTNAFGASGTLAAGVREVFGTHGKPLHAGHAAENGLRAATWALAGFTGGNDIVGGRRGFWAVASRDGHSKDALISQLGEHWEFKMNGLKPFANGIVSHPIQQAVIELRNEFNLKPEDIESIKAITHPLVLELMNRANPIVGLEGKFSFQHCAAAALVDGAGHDAQFTDKKVNDPTISNVRSKVSATIGKDVSEDEVHLQINLADGRKLKKHIKHAVGSPTNPMTDEELMNKYRALSGEILPKSQAENLATAVWDLDNASNVFELCNLMRA